MKTTALILSLAAAGLSAAPSGWQFHQGQAGKPAVLLIHGLAASKTHWTEPNATWSIKPAHYDHRKKVKDRDGDKDYKKVAGAKVYEALVGIESLRLSPKDDDAGKSGSFWKYLVDQGYTVATWNQVPCMDSGSMPSKACKDQDTFAPAYATAKDALAELAKLSGDAPIALVGHSRGGLIARKLLKDAVPGRERVKWLITLHSPHQGSGMATMGVGLQKALDRFDEVVDLGFLPQDLRKPAQKLLPDVGGKLNGAIDMLVSITGMEGARELAKNGATLQSLESGEGKPSGVRVATFGGTSPKVAEAYLFLYSAKSALPTEKEWKAKDHKLFDFPGDMKVGFDEIKDGGDLLVTDRASRLPWEDKHYEHALNHAEVLWNRTVQKEVLAELQIQP